MNWSNILGGTHGGGTTRATLRRKAYTVDMVLLANKLFGCYHESVQAGYNSEGSCAADRETPLDTPVSHMIADS